MHRSQRIWQNRKHHFILFTTSILLGSILSFSASAYELIDLGVGIKPQDVNNHLTVVGTRSTGPTTSIAFRWTSEAGLQDFVYAVEANAVNDNEQIAGNTLTGAFFVDNGAILEWDGFSVQGMNAGGSLSGNKTMDNVYRPTPLPLAPAVFDGQDWNVYDIANVSSRGTRKGVYADLYMLEDINDMGLAVGYKGRTGLASSYAIQIDTNRTINNATDVTYLPIPTGGEATAINNQNMIVGTSRTNLNTNSYAYAYLYDGVNVHNLGTLHGGLTSSAADINDDNIVVGSSSLATEITSVKDPTQYRAFVWDETNGMRDLNELVDAGDWILTSATAINAYGDIVGTGILNGEEHGFLLSSAHVTAPPATNEPPLAVASSQLWRGRAPLTVNFSAAGSSDPDGSIISYEWDFGDGTTGTGLNTTHTYTQRGIHIALLTVTDNQGMSATDEIEIRVFRSR
jgi:probable HAF family extracellular repeat protein